MIGENNTITTYRLATTSGKETYESAATVEDEPCYLVMSSPDIAVMFENVPAYEVFSCYMDDAQDIIISDKVVDDQGNEYIVKKVTKYENNSDLPNDTTELVMFKKYDGT